MSIELIAPAKVNLTLEALARRADGYHEIATLMQTIDLCDRITIEPATGVELVLTGEALAGVPVEGPGNLAYKAAVALMVEARNLNLGARITLEKHIPAGMGLAGGSSDAAAVLRGLNRFWDLGLPIAEVAAGLGSDVPFFLQAGTAECRGRGERVERLPDYRDQVLTLFLSDIEIADKTRRMYSLLVSGDFTEGHGTSVAARTVERGLPLTPTDIANVFDRHIFEAAPAAGKAMALSREAGLDVHAIGSGPGFFTLLPSSDVPPLLVRKLAESGVSLREVRTLPRKRALAVEEV